jgi:hypothetical protein
VRNGDEIALLRWQSKLPVGFETVDTDALDGDVPAQYVFDDYKAVDGVQLPHKITIKKNGKDYSSVQYTSAAINDPAAQKEFEIPEAASQEADTAIAAGPNDYSPVAISKSAKAASNRGQVVTKAFVVEMRDYLVVFDAPVSDWQSNWTISQLQGKYPGKPIRYAAVTHHHSDHIGGVRGLAAAGATILVEKGHTPALQSLVAVLVRHGVGSGAAWATRRGRGTNEAVITDGSRA